MNKSITIKHLVKEDISSIVTILKDNEINRSEQYFTNCYSENISDMRMTLIANYNGEFAGFCHLIFHSAYGYFKTNGIPELNDLVVIPKYRRKGIGRELVRECEHFAKTKFTKIGLGVGLYKDYGNAHKLYVNLGYQPDGNGIFWRNESVIPGSQIFIDDDLLLYFWKKLEDKDGPSLGKVSGAIRRKN